MVEESQAYIKGVWGWLRKAPVAELQPKTSVVSAGRRDVLKTTALAGFAAASGPPPATLFSPMAQATTPNTSKILELTRRCTVYNNSGLYGLLRHFEAKSLDAKTGPDGLSLADVKIYYEIAQHYAKNPSLIMGTSLKLSEMTDPLVIMTAQYLQTGMGMEADERHIQTMENDIAIRAQEVAALRRFAGLRKDEDVSLQQLHARLAVRLDTLTKQALKNPSLLPADPTERRDAFSWLASACGEFSNENVIRQGYRDTHDGTSPPVYEGLENLSSILNGKEEYYQGVAHTRTLQHTENGPAIGGDLLNIPAVSGPNISADNISQPLKLLEGGNHAENSQPAASEKEPEKLPSPSGAADPIGCHVLLTKGEAQGDPLDHTLRTFLIWPAGHDARPLSRADMLAFIRKEADDWGESPAPPVRMEPFFGADEVHGWRITTDNPQIIMALRLYLPQETQEEQRLSPHERMQRLRQNPDSGPLLDIPVSGQGKGR